MPDIDKLINVDSMEFMSSIDKKDNGYSMEYADELDSQDELGLHLRSLFDTGEITAFAGHSLGTVFKPGRERILRILALQARQLHGGHFPETEKSDGNWFDCDIVKESLEDMQKMLGFADLSEFIYTQAGLSENLRLLLSTFYRPSKRDWESGKTGICYLGKEFFSDQAVIHSLIDSERVRAQSNRLFQETPCPETNDLCLTIAPDARGIYQEDIIIEYVKNNAHKMKVLHLSDVVFSTGQRIDIDYVLTELKDTIKQHNIVVGLDLAHTAGNRTIDLKKLAVVTYAVGCAYKHMSGSAGSGFGIYVNKDVDLSKTPVINGWKGAESGKVFSVIDGYDPTIMATTGARAFRCSNPSPVALAPVLEYVKIMGKIGWDTLKQRSESLTKYMIALLQKHLRNEIEFVTPLFTVQRGATLVFRIKNITDIDAIEHLLKKDSEFGQFEVDTRKPNNIRVTAHYGYTKFGDIHRMVMRLKKVISLQQSVEQGMKPGHEITPQQTNFNKQLAVLQTKIDELSKRAEDAREKSDYLQLKKAKVAAITLHENLTMAGTSYFRKDSDEASFKIACDQAFKKAHVELDKHRGWSEFLINLAIGLTTLGIGLLIKGAINLSHNQSFFSVCKTKSSTDLDGVEANIYNEIPRK